MAAVEESDAGTGSPAKAQPRYARRISVGLLDTTFLTVFYLAVITGSVLAIVVSGRAALDMALVSFSRTDVVAVRAAPTTITVPNTPIVAAAPLKTPAPVPAEVAIEPRITTSVAANSIVAATAPAQTMLVKSGVNIRSEPSGDSAAVGLLARGEQVEISETKGRWYKVAISSAVLGWVYGDYLGPSEIVPEAAESSIVALAPPAQDDPDGSFEEAALTSPVATPPMSDGRVMIVRSGVNYRSDPSNSSRALGVLRSGQQVEVVGMQQGWAQVSVSSQVLGWVYGSFLQAQ